MPPEVPELALVCPSAIGGAQDSNLNVLVSRALNPANWETVSQDPQGWPGGGQQTPWPSRLVTSDN